MNTIKQVRMGDRHGWEIYDHAGRRVGWYHHWPAAGDARRDVETILKTVTVQKTK